MDDDEAPLMAPCETCGGSGVASCCDTAGAYITASNQEKKSDFVCLACGARQTDRMIVCEECGKPLVFPVRDVA